MKSNLFWSHISVATTAVILTTGIWLTAYFVAVAPNINKKTIINDNTNNYCIPASANCEIPEMPQCAETCDNRTAQIRCLRIYPNRYGIQLELSDFQLDGRLLVAFDKYYIAGLTSLEKYINKISDEAKKEILIGSYYWSLLVKDTGDGYETDPTNTSDKGALIYEELLKSSLNRNISIRIAQTFEEEGNAWLVRENPNSLTGYWETTNLAKTSKGNIRVRSLDFKQWYPGGILHTKSWAVDGKHFYIGSANFDWRSLTQVKELGIAAFNCPCMGNDLKNLLEIYWRMGAPGAKIPQQWDNDLSTPANHQNPMSVNQNGGSQAMYISASPPGFQSCGREDDLNAMIKTIDEAKEYIYLAVMDYSPSTLYLTNANKWKPALDNAIRRAAFERAVQIRFLVSLWPHTYQDIYGLMYSLQDISDHLPCYSYDANGACIKQGSIEIRFIEVPLLQFGKVPYARVYHNKYFVTENAAYIGTSNWSSDYWEYTAGIGIVIRSDDSSSKSTLVDEITSVFERDWNSMYTIPLKNFTISGNKTITFSH